MLKYNLLLYLVSPFILLKLIIYSLRNSTSLSYLINKLFGKNLTKSYYDALKRIKELTEQVQELKNEVESLKEDKVELRSIRGH